MSGAAALLIVGDFFFVATRGLRPRLARQLRLAFLPELLGLLAALPRLLDQALFFVCHEPLLPLRLAHEPPDDVEVAVGLLEDRRVGALLEDDLLRGGDSLRERLRDRRRAHVVAAADDERRHADLAEAVADVPAAQGAGDRPLVRSLHRAVDVRGPLLAPAPDLGA